MRRLYHCMNQTPRGDFIRASYLMEMNGREDRYVFAATHLSKSLAFAFSYHDGEVMMNGGIDNTENEFILLCGGQKTLDHARHVYVYTFPDDGFTELEGSRQAVSTVPVLFSKTELLFETSDINLLMQKGLQIFLLPEDLEFYQKLYSGHMADGYFLPDEREGQSLRRLRDKMDARWINQERAINPCPALSADIVVKRAATFKPTP